MVIRTNGPYKTHLRELSSPPSTLLILTQKKSPLPALQGVAEGNSNKISLIYEKRSTYQYNKVLSLPPSPGG